MTISSWFGVVLGGAIGASLRYLLQLLIPNIASFSMAVLCANIIGCFCLGVFLGLSLKMHISPFWLNFIQVGLLGALTTFSALIADVSILQEKNEILWSMLYPLLSIILGLMAYYIGFYIMKIW